MSTSRRPVARPVSHADSRVGARANAPRESIQDILRDIAQRRFAEFSGLVLIAMATVFTVALMSWSVRDPSFNYAVDGPVKNWLGMPGAIASDVAIQLFGVAILAVVAPVVVWGLILIKARGLDRLTARVGSWVLGIFGAAAFASLLPRADSWPLPTGMGGAVGDGLERLPLMLIGSSGVAKIAASLVFAVIAILALHFAMSRSAAAQSEDEEDTPRARRHSDLDEDEHRDDEPSRAIVLIGAAVHGVAVTARAVARTVTSFRDGAGHRIASGTRQIVERATRDDHSTYAMAGVAGAAQQPRREPVLRHDPVVAHEAMSEVAAPVYQRRVSATEPVVAPVALATPTAAIVPTDSQPVARTAGYGAAVSALQHAAKRRLGLLKTEPLPVEPPAVVVADQTRPGERAAIEALQAAARRRMASQHVEPRFDDVSVATPLHDQFEPAADDEDTAPRAIVQAPRAATRVAPPAAPLKPGKREVREAQPDLLGRDTYELPPLSLLNEPKRGNTVAISEDSLDQPGGYTL
jgi:DNA segregation ATPase FtsK/SpoIIIE, S-DNA-T family